MERRILALDLARKSAAAWRAEDGTIRTFPFCLGEEGADNEGARLVKLRKELLALVALSGCDSVSVELDTGQHSTATAVLRRYHGIAKMVGEECGVPVLVKITASGARKTVLDFGYSQKEDVRAAVISLGRFDPSQMNDDEMDAAVLLLASEVWYVADDMVQAVKAEAVARSREVLSNISASVVRLNKGKRRPLSREIVDRDFDSGLGFLCETGGRVRSGHVR